MPGEKLSDLRLEVLGIRLQLDIYKTLGELAEKVGIADGNLSKLKNGKVSGVRFKTLNAICKELDCQPGDLLEFVDDEEG